MHLTHRLASYGGLWLAVPAMAFWLFGCVTWMYLFGSNAGTPRVRVRDIEFGEQLVTLHFPVRRHTSAPAAADWSPTTWSADDIAPWSPQRDQR